MELMQQGQGGNIKVFNPNKEISTEITLEILIRHRDALKQARTGELVGMSVESINDNDRKINQVRALSLIIASQREMINISRPIIVFSSTQKWKKKFKGEEEQKENPFENEKNDYSDLISWKDFLRSCEMAVLNAEKTKKLDDDFLLKKQTNDGDVNELTDNFYEMLEDLENSYEQIYLLMLTNKIVSAGIEEDEELTYKEQEQLFISRVQDA